MYIKGINLFLEEEEENMWNVLFIIPIISTVISIILNIYLYLENRKLKGFEIDENIELKKIEIKEQKRLYQNRKIELAGEIERRGWTTSGKKIEKERDLELEYKNIFDKLNEELSHLKKQKKYKWLFSKDC